MLQAVLELFQQAPSSTLSQAAIARQLNIAPVMLEHMLRTLTRSGKLVEVADCADCGICPLAKFCVGGVDLRQRGYRLASQGMTHP